MKHLSISIVGLSALFVLLALVSAALQAQPHPRDTPTNVFRIDTRPPETVFKEGFKNNGYAFSLLAHALGRTCAANSPLRRSAWISTTGDRAQAERFLRRQFEHRQAQADTTAPMQAWLYTIRTDDEFLHLENVLRQVIQAGLQTRDGYRPAHARVLQHIVANSNIHDRQEVVSERINPERIETAIRVTYMPSAPTHEQLVWGEGTSNALFHPPSRAEEMNNQVTDIHDLVPPDSEDFAGVAYRTENDGACFQTCDATARRHRQKRSLTDVALDYCPGQPSRLEALVGSED